MGGKNNGEIKEDNRSVIKGDVEMDRQKSPLFLNSPYGALLKTVINSPTGLS